MKLRRKLLLELAKNGDERLLAIEIIGLRDVQPLRGFRVQPGQSLGRYNGAA